jgi:hypothetical protein
MGARVPPPAEILEHRPSPPAALGQPAVDQVDRAAVDRAALRRAALGEMAERVRPRVLAQDDLVPVAPAFAELLGAPGIRKGAVAVVEDGGVPGATSVALGLLAAATTAGLWCAVVDFPTLGLLAASELGVDLDRVVLVPSTGLRQTAIVAALLDGCDVVLVALDQKFSLGEARRLAARARERRAVLLACCPHPAGGRGAVGIWPEVPDLALQVTGSRFVGLGAGNGHLRAHFVEVAVHRRRAAPGARRAGLWLPDEQGALVYEPIGPVLAGISEATAESR